MKDDEEEDDVMVNLHDTYHRDKNPNRHGDTSGSEPNGGCSEGKNRSGHVLKFTSKKNKQKKLRRLQFLQHKLE